MVSHMNDNSFYSFEQYSKSSAGYWAQNKVHSDIHDILIRDILSKIEYTIENIYRKKGNC